MPTKSAALSLVPNVATAKSFIHGGVKSMNVEPRAIRGVARAVKNAPDQFRNGQDDGGGGHPGQGGQRRGSPEPLHELLHDLGS